MCSMTISRRRLRSLWGFFDEEILIQYTKTLILFRFPMHKILRCTSSSPPLAPPPQSGSFHPRSGGRAGERGAAFVRFSMIVVVVFVVVVRSTVSVDRPPLSRPTLDSGRASAPLKSVSTNSPTAAIGHLKLGDSRLFLDLTLEALLPNY